MLKTAKLGKVESEELPEKKKNRDRENERIRKEQIKLKDVDVADMMKIPKKEEDLLDYPVYTSMKGNQFVEDMITAKDIGPDNAWLKLIFDKDDDAAIEMMKQL